MMKDSTARNIGSAAFRGITLLGVWLSLTRGEMSSIAIGLVAVAVTTAMSIRVLPPARGRLHVRRLPGFLWRFGVASLVGGADVARRAMALRPGLAPDLIVCRLELASVRQRVLLANLVTLLPGTLSADLNEFELTVHALDVNQDIRSRIHSLELQVQSLWGESRE